MNFPRHLSLKLPRGSLRSLGIVHDVLIAACSITVAMGLAWGWAPLLTYWQIWALILAYTGLSAIIFPLFSLNRGAWRYASLLDVLSIVKAVTTINIVFMLGNFILFRGAYLPRSAVAISWFVMIVGLGGPRLAYRLMKERGLTERTGNSHNSSFPRQNVLLCGFNDNADLFIRNARRVYQDAHIVGIIDEQRKNQKRQLHGIRVLGSLSELQTILKKAEMGATPVTELIITRTDAPPYELAAIVSAASPFKIAIKKLPDISHAGAIKNGSEIAPTPVLLEDLLGRKVVDLDVRTVAKLINQRCVVVTGAGGSIGAELVRQIAMFEPAGLILIDNSEFNLWAISRQMIDDFPSVSFVSRVADVRQGERLQALFSEFKPDVIFHAAALKHVPIVEDNPLEGIETNLIGTRNVADAALACGAKAFVMVSTDKAVNPTSIMGATKRAAEAYCQALDLSQSDTRFMTVRFGNVLGSNGSVIPLFQSQLQRGGPLTVTHPNITRYFMTIHEASRLILHAAGIGMEDRAAQGQIFVLDMGEPIRIAELAERLIQLAGLRPHRDIEIKFVGLRRGEKLYEELFGAGETVEMSGRSGFMIARSRVSDIHLLRRNIEAIEGAIHGGDGSRAVELLAHVVPEFTRRADGLASVRVDPQQARLPEAFDG
ncbi:polysaccharide biosynthesis protein [Mangrovicella endophytica]|uniref:polysaccharide biosynthesis protein n=1 Tax=Mangrovicella endophytica TaxID=2066697 RepID=UPI000C9E2586|nr:nucleoside-diphosphate sugar epimerase/dehydratase [Mangrovicella endophytica]